MSALEKRTSAERDAKGQQATFEMKEAGQTERLTIFCRDRGWSL